MSSRGLDPDDPRSGLIAERDRSPVTRRRGGDGRRDRRRSSRSYSRSPESSSRRRPRSRSRSRSRSPGAPSRRSYRDRSYSPSPPGPRRSGYRDDRYRRGGPPPPPSRYGGPPPYDDYRYRDYGPPPDEYRYREHGPPPFQRPPHGRGPPYGGGPPPPGRGGGGDRRVRRDDGPPGVSLLIRNVAPDIQSQDLLTAFGRIGEVRDVYIPRDFHSQQPKGFAFIEYATAEQAREARDEMDRFVVRGRELEVVFAQERRKTPTEMRGRVVNEQNRDGSGDADRRARGSERSSSFERHKQQQGVSAVGNGAGKREDRREESPTRKDT
jgi:hypothetical protein